MSLERILGVGSEEITVLGVCHEEWCVLLLQDFLNTTAEHAADGVGDIVLCVVSHGVAQLAWECFVLHEEDAHVGGLLLVLLDGNDWLVVVGHWIVFAHGTVLHGWNVGKGLLDFLLHLVNIHVAHDDDALQVRTIPLVVVVADVLVWEVHHDFHRSDWHAICIFAARINLWECLFLHTLHG